MFADLLSLDIFKIGGELFAFRIDRGFYGVMVVKRMDSLCSRLVVKRMDDSSHILPSSVISYQLT